MALSTIPTRALSEQGINFRNLIINGDMSISQRGTSQTGMTSSQYPYAPDRFHYNLSSAGTWTVSQSTDVPSGQGFGYSEKFDCTTANASLGTNSFAIIRQKIEAQNLQHLKYGTSNAESITLSFWVKSNKTGTYNVWFYTEDTAKSTSAQYTISSASTWEKKTITISGTNSGTIDNNKNDGMRVNFMLAAGTDWTSGSTPSSWETDTKANRAPSQVNLADSTSNEWYITGVQLEVGTTASDFEFLPHDVNLRRCQRYYQQVTSAIGPSVNSTTGRGFGNLVPEMRASPSYSATDVLGITDGYSADFGQSSSNISLIATDAKSFFIAYGNFSGLTTGRTMFFPRLIQAGKIYADAEL